MLIANGEKVIIRGNIKQKRTTILILVLNEKERRWDIWHNFIAESNSEELKRFLRVLDLELFGA